MTTASPNQHVIAVIGSGPAGLYAAKQFAASGVRVALLNRDIKPGGLAEYGIYHDKHKMKEGLRKQFRQILASPEIDYFGNISVGQDGDLTLDDLRALGFQSLMVTVGAQGTKWLGLPGEDLKGIYHAKDIVYHYNKLPPFSTQEYMVHGRVAIIGVGNVMMDIAHWAIRDLKVDSVTAIARRGPAEVKFSKKEMENVANNLDLEALEAELARVEPVMQAVGQDVNAARENILAGLPKALEPVSDTRFKLEFLASPTQMFGNDQGKVCGLELEDTTLVLKDGDTKARGLGTKRMVDVDAVIFCIGDRVDDNFGLPVKWNAFVKSPEPRFPVGGLSFEAYDPEAGKPIEDVFVAGWSREASNGLVGVARKDGECGAQALLAYLQTKPPAADSDKAVAALADLLKRKGKRTISKEDILRLEAFEGAEAERLGLEEYKLKTNQEMLEAIG